MKQVIKLNESQFHKMIAESVQKILSELEWNANVNTTKKQEKQSEKGESKALNEANTYAGTKNYHKFYNRPSKNQWVYDPDEYDENGSYIGYENDESEDEYDNDCYELYSASKPNDKIHEFVTMLADRFENNLNNAIKNDASLNQIKSIQNASQNPIRVDVYSDINVKDTDDDDMGERRYHHSTIFNFVVYYNKLKKILTRVNDAQRFKSKIIAIISKMASLMFSKLEGVEVSFTTPSQLGDAIFNVKLTFIEVSLIDDTGTRTYGKNSLLRNNNMIQIPGAKRSPYIQKNNNYKNFNIDKI